MKSKKLFVIGSVFAVLFVIWTVLIKLVDIQPVGVNGTDIGFTALNTWFHSLTGINMWLYTVIDWLGIVPLFVCAVFGVMGLVQLLKRKSIFKVDSDILILGFYYIIVILCYLLFETYPVNYRPVLINGLAEASYPSSTTLLVLCVMPTLIQQSDSRINSRHTAKTIKIFTALFSVLMVVGRLISGVHWLTDIIGSVLLSAGLFMLYKSAVAFTQKQGE